jgi:3',5'-cyclic AMP phosphodiesterase CpdA
MPQAPLHSTSRRHALKCLAFGSAGTVFALSGGVLTPMNLAWGTSELPKLDGAPLFVQISDTHIGFSKEANPDVNGTLTRTIAQVNNLPKQPAFILHTGDITHLSKPAEFDTAAQILTGLKTPELHTVPGEHDVTDGTGETYFSRYGAASNGKGYYSFDHQGVHMIGLVNVMNFKPGGLGALGDEQMAWLRKDLAARSTSTPIVLFAHMPLWTVYEPWGWGTAEADEIAALVRRFGSVTVLNGHIHQIVQKVEGHLTYHTARSTAYPQPTPGDGPGPGPLKVAADELPRRLGVTYAGRRKRVLSLTDETLA